jgi:hypothetical protein
MDPIDAASASGDAISGFASHFMLDMATYARGGELGYQGLDFYVAGRGGALGDVPAGVVAAALVFFNPETVAHAWDRSRSLLPRLEVAAEFAALGHAWAEQALPDDVDAERLAALAGAIVDAASPAAAPLFAGWCALEEPDTSRPKALALHRVNALRELRGALHGAAILTHGISTHAAMTLRSPGMLAIFGWEEPHPDPEEIRSRWDEAQAATEVAIAPAYAALAPAEREEFVTLVNAAQAAVTAR